MKLVTRDTDYAIRALCYIVNTGEGIISVNDIVKQLKIPRPFLRKICQTLNKNKIIRSYRGKGGGFELLISSEKILLMDLISIFQGPLKIKECLFKKNPCQNQKRCLLNKKLDEIEKYITKELGSVTIASLAKSMR